MIGSAAAEPIVFEEAMTMSVTQETRIGDLLVAHGLVNENQVAGALRLQGMTGQRLGEVLVDQGLISWMDVASALQVQWRRKVPPISVTEVAEARSYKDTDATLRSQLAKHQARIAELSETVDVLQAALADCEGRLALILALLQAPSAR